MSTFERYLTLWVALCIVVGLALGHFLPGAFQAIGAMEIASVNLPVAVLIWLMVQVVREILNPELDAVGPDPLAGVLAGRTDRFTLPGLGAADQAQHGPERSRHLKW